MTPKSNRIETALIAALALTVILAAAAPRLLAFLPPIFGLIFFIWNGIITKQWKPDLRIVVPFVIIGGLTLLSSLWAIHPSDAVERAGRVVGILLGGAGLLMATKTPSSPNRTIPLAVLFLAAFMAMELIFDFPFYRITHPDKAGEKIADAVANRSIVTATLLMIPAFALAKIQWGWKKSTLAFMPVFGTLFVVTESQSAQLGMLVALIFACLFPYRWKAAWIGLGAVVATLTLTAPFLAPYLFQHFVHEAAAVPNIGDGSANIAPRLEIWDFVSHRALQKPFFGFGIEATRDILDFDTQHLYYPSVKVLHPHNIVLQIWIEFGTFGAILAAVGFSLLLRQIYKTCSTAQARIALPVLMTTLSIGAMSYGLWQGWWIGLLILTATVTLIAINTVKAHSPAT